MSSRKTWVAGLLLVAVAPGPRVWAQIPGAAATPGGASNATNAALAAAGAGGATPAAAAPATAAAPQTLFGFLGLSSANIHACITKLCGTPLGQMANSLVTGPLGGVSGGLIPPLCPPAPTPGQIAALESKAPGGAEATAAKIKASEADAKARVAAVEYLGTVDCTRWKEATKAIVNALRADPNECVRYAAARVLNSGCCCNKETIEALKVCVAGEDKDGNPPETSARVKAAAFNALQNCLMKVPEVLPEEAPKRIEREHGTVPNLEPLPDQKPIGRERSSMKDGVGTHIATSLSIPATAGSRYDRQSQSKTLSQTVNEARQTLVDVSRTAKPSPTLPPGKRSLLDAFIKARQDLNAKSRTAPAAGPPANNSGVVPTSYTPDSRPDQGAAISPDGASNPTVSGETRRGLIGLLLNSRNRGTNQ